jgi:putative endonuclease
LYFSEAIRSERSAAPEGIPLGPALAHYLIMFFLYILYSESKDRHYIGQSNDLDDRIQRHNNGRVRSTKFGIPWKLVYHEQYATRSESVSREQFLKSPDGWLELKKIKEQIEL